MPPSEFGSRLERCYKIAPPDYMVPNTVNEACSRCLQLARQVSTNSDGDVSLLTRCSVTRKVAAVIKIPARSVAGLVEAIANALYLGAPTTTSYGGR